MKSCFTVSGNITKSLMGTTNFLWANCTEKKGMGVFFDWLNARIFLWPFLSNLQRYVADPSSFLVLWSSYLFFFSLVFPSPTFFTFGGGTCVTSAFFSVLLLDGILTKKNCNVTLSSYWLSFVWFYTNESSGIKRTKWFGYQLFSKSVSVVCDHNIDAVFSVLTRGEIVTFKSFRLTMGFFDSG